MRLVGYLLIIQVLTTFVRSMNLSSKQQKYVTSNDDKKEFDLSILLLLLGFEFY